jgi:hypothetical protein
VVAVAASIFHSVACWEMSECHVHAIESCAVRVVGSQSAFFGIYASFAFYTIILYVLPYNSATVPFAIKGVPFGIMGRPFVLEGIPSALKGRPSIVKGVPIALKGIPSALKGRPSDIKGIPFWLFLASLVLK